MNSRGYLFVRDLDQDLRVVQLLELRGRRKPEPRTSAADESRDVTEHGSGRAAVLRVLLSELCGLYPDCLLYFARVIVGCAQIGVIGQPDIDV